MAATNKKIIKNSLKALALFGLLNQNALAADVSFLGTLDTTSSGKVSTAKMLGKGTIKTGVFMDASSYAVPLKSFSPEDSNLSLSNDKLLENANKTSLFVGYGLFDWLELSLGLRSTTDEISDSNRKEFFQRFDHGAYYEKNVDGAESGFSYAGSIFSAKFLAYDGGNFKLGVAGFIEEGVGHEATYSASKSESMKVGYMGLATYGYKDLGQVNLNIGYRSRKAEEIGGSHIGNEVFAKTSLMYHINKRWGVYSTLESRSIKVAKTTEYDKNGYLDYDSEIETLSQLGVTGYLYDNYKMDAYVGGGLSSQTSVGNSERYFGLSISVPLYKESQQRAFVAVPVNSEQAPADTEQAVSEKSVNDDDIYGIDNSKPNKKKALENKIAKEKKQKKPEEYPEMAGDVDYNFTGTDDDFEKAKRKSAKTKKEKVVDIDREIEKYKKLDALKEKKENAPKYSLEDRRNRYREYMKEKRAAEQKIAEKLQKELGAEYTITDEDANWTGLEH